MYAKNGNWTDCASFMKNVLKVYNIWIATSQDNLINKIRILIVGLNCAFGLNIRNVQIEGPVL